MNACYLCAASDLELLLDCGPQPISNRFLKSPQEPEQLYPMTIWQCHSCGTIQLRNPPPAAELRPKVDWITYNEPEGHLDQLAGIVADLPGLNSESVIGGVSFKDDSTIARLQRKGFKNTWRLEPATDLGVAFQGVGVETIQDGLTPEAGAETAGKRGEADLLIVRHILEHTHQPLRFLEALIRLVRPGGYLVFEVPDCSRALDNLDYTTLWEEHTLYFTPETFRGCFAFAEVTPVRFEVYPYPFENSLIAILRRDRPPRSGGVPPQVLDSEVRRASRFATEFPRRRDQIKRFLTNYTDREGPIAMFGAGHLAGTFIYLLGLKDVIRFVADDNPHKQGLFMPGSHAPIRGSSALWEEKIRLSLLSVNPESEAKVIQKQRAFVERGGVFASIFPASEHALKIPA